ncbi:hypothetical protein ACFWFZ_03895 [Streptomyces sp. NPDC060232]|uniref:hypothetical protein n=1 Tax=Streptomyces sp. NPDC060232 TaxID=3347079 RepID=UPI00365A85BF
MQNHINAFARLSDSLHVQREDHGAHPALLNRQDIVNSSNRLAFLTEGGEISAYTWITVARMVRKWLELMRGMGLTHPGQPLHGLPAEFALLAQDIPDEPEESEAGKDLPDEVMRQLCGNLDLLEQKSSREVRVAVELLIDTGRRPFEICSLPYDCVTRCRRQTSPPLRQPKGTAPSTSPTRARTHLCPHHSTAGTRPLPLPQHTDQQDRPAAHRHVQPRGHQADRRRPHPAP